MKKIIFLVVALLVLVGGGVGGYLFLFKKDAKTAEEEAKAEEAKKPLGPPQFVEIGPMVLPIMGATRIEQNLQLVVQVQVTGDEKREFVRNNRYRLQDAYIRALYGKLGAEQVRAGQVIDIVQVQKWLVEATDKVLGEGYADDVLIGAVNQHPAY